MRKSLVLGVLKFCVGAGLLAWLVYRFDVQDALATIAAANGSDLLMSLAAFVLASIFEVSKFRAACHFRISQRVSAILVFIGLFLNSFLPSSIGGDGYKLWGLRKCGVAPKAALGYVISDRISGLLALILLGSAAYALSPKSARVFSQLRFEPQASEWIAGAGAVIALVVVTLLVLRSQPRLQERIRRATIMLVAAVRTHLAIRMLPILGYALLLHLFRGIALWFICRATGFAVPLTAILQILMLVALVSMLPVTLGGLGIREGTLAFLLKRSGMSPEAALAAALICLAVIWLKSIVGAAVFFAERRLAPSHPMPIDGPNNEPIYSIGKALPPPANDEQR